MPTDSYNALKVAPQTSDPDPREVIPFGRYGAGLPSSQGSGYDLQSKGRNIEVKTRRSFKGGFVQLGERQFEVLCKERNYWIYVVCISRRKKKIIEFPRRMVLPRIRPNIHYNFVFGTNDLK